MYGSKLSSSSSMAIAKDMTIDNGKGWQWYEFTSCTYLRSCSQNCFLHQTKLLVPRPACLRSICKGQFKSTKPCSYCSHGYQSTTVAMIKEVVLDGWQLVGIYYVLFLRMWGVFIWLRIGLRYCKLCKYCAKTFGEHYHPTYNFNPSSLYRLMLLPVLQVAVSMSSKLL